MPNALPLISILPVPEEVMFAVPLKPIASSVPLPTPLIVMALPEAEEEILTVEARAMSCTPNKRPKRFPEAVVACASNSTVPLPAFTLTCP